jgi:hypothetical protein
MENLAELFIGIFKFIFELIARILFENIFHTIVGGTGLLIIKLFRINVIVKDDMDALGAGCFPYILGMTFYGSLITLLTCYFNNH